MGANHDQNVLKDRQLLLLFSSQSDVNDHVLRDNLADCDLIVANFERIISSHLHLGHIADVVIGISHDELEIQASEGIEEVEFGTVNVGVALELDLESNIFVSWRNLEDGVALADSVVNYSEPLALGGAEFDIGRVEEGQLIVRELSLDLVFSFMSEDVRGNDVVQSRLGLLEEIVEDGVITAPRVSQELDNVAVDD